MFSRFIATAAVLAAIAGAGGAQARDLTPMEGQTVILGDVTGVVYYTVGPRGYRVVATLGAASGTSIRFIATLQPYQTVVVSVPRGPGESPMEAVVSRDGNRLSVTRDVSEEWPRQLVVR